MMPLHWIGNRFLSLVTNVLYSSTLSDMETCYKLFDRRVLEGITIESDKFDFEPEITAKVLRRGYRIYEVPISYAGREADEGKKITWRDGFGALQALVKFRFTRLDVVTDGRAVGAGRPASDGRPRRRPASPWWWSTTSRVRPWPAAWRGSGRGARPSWWWWTTARVDGSLDALRRRFPDVEVVVPGRNLGYGAAANRGVAATTAPLGARLQPRPRGPSGGAGRPGRGAGRRPRLRAGRAARSGTRTASRYPSARRFPVAGRCRRPRPARDLRPGQPVHPLVPAGRPRTGAGVGPELVDWVSGACFLVRRSAFEEVGGFDEAYFMYAEDVDLCWRLGRAGWRVAYVPAAEVTHLQGVSTDRHPYRMIVEHHRSLLRFAARSSEGWRRALLPLVALGIGARAVPGLPGAEVIRRLTRPAAGAPDPQVVGCRPIMASNSTGKTRRANGWSAPPPPVAGGPTAARCRSTGTPAWS